MFPSHDREKRREKWLDKLAETRRAKIDVAHKMGGANLGDDMLKTLENIAAAMKEHAAATIQEAEYVEISIDD